VTRESSKLEVGRKSRVFHWSKKFKEKLLLGSFNSISIENTHKIG
jgi:hypothetical protein